MRTNKALQIFVDTSFFKALLDPSDDFYVASQKTLAKLTEQKASFVTSNYIIDECATLIRAKCGLELALRFREQLAQGMLDLKIVRVLAKDESRAWDWFKNDWSRLSFTDCVSFTMMERLEIKKVATFDGHFLRAKFEVQ